MEDRRGRSAAKVHLQDAERSERRKQTDLFCNLAFS